jgi:hypothetical protein
VTELFSGAFEAVFLLLAHPTTIEAAAASVASERAAIFIGEFSILDQPTRPSVAGCSEALYRTACG